MNTKTTIYCLRFLHMKAKKLTFIESLMLVAGAGIGTGILTIPYAIDKIGVFGTLFSLICLCCKWIYVYDYCRFNTQFKKTR